MVDDQLKACGPLSILDSPQTGQVRRKTETGCSTY